MKNRILFLIPFILYLLFGLAIVLQGLSIDIITFILSSVLLLFTGIGLESNNKYLKLIGLGSLAIFVTFYVIIGYYDYLKWISTIIGIVNLIYFVLICMLKNIKC